MPPGQVRTRYVAGLPRVDRNVQLPVSLTKLLSAQSAMPDPATLHQIAEIAYHLRASTGHTGSLLGWEKTFCYSHHLRLFEPTSDAVFDYAILGQLRNASRQVLARALGRPWMRRYPQPGPRRPAAARSGRDPGSRSLLTPSIVSPC